MWEEVGLIVCFNLEVHFGIASHSFLPFVLLALLLCNPSILLFIPPHPWHSNNTGPCHARQDRARELDYGI